MQVVVVVPLYKTVGGGDGEKCSYVDYYWFYPDTTYVQT